MTISSRTTGGLWAAPACVGQLQGAENVHPAAPAWRGPAEQPARRRTAPGQHHSRSAEGPECDSQQKRGALSRPELSG